MYHIDITEPAELDMLEAATYIAVELHNRAAADRLLDDAIEAINSLEEMPQRHPLVDDAYLTDRGFRSFPVHNYLVFYAVREARKTVVIERFIYGKRDWVNILKSNNPSETCIF